MNKSLSENPCTPRWVDPALGKYCVARRQRYQHRFLLPPCLRPKPGRRGRKGFRIGSKVHRSGLAGKYIVIPLVVVTFIVGIAFMIIRHWGRGAAETNFLVTSYMSGLRDLDEGYYKSAIAHFTVVIESGTRPAAWGFRGEAYLHLKEYEKAEADFRQAIRHEPQKAVNYAGLAEALAGQNRYPAALKALDEAIALFPSVPKMDPEDKTVPRTGDSLEELKSRRAELAAKIEKGGSKMEDRE